MEDNTAGQNLASINESSEARFRCRTTRTYETVEASAVHTPSRQSSGTAAYTRPLEVHAEGCPVDYGEPHHSTFLVPAESQRRPRGQS